MALDGTTMDYWIVVFGAAFIVITGSPYGGVDDCREEKLAQCVPNMSHFLDNRQRIFPTSEVELNSVCETLNAEIECIEKYVFMCFTEEKKDLYHRSRKDWISIIDDLCSSGDFRNEYLRHAQCFNDSSSNYKQCIGSYHHLLQESLSGTDPVTSDVETAEVETTLVRYCCAYSEFVTCIFQKVLRFCDPETILFYRNFITRSTLLAFQDHCTNYTVGSEWCSSVGRSSASRLVICAALLLQVWTMWCYGTLISSPVSRTPT